VFFWGRRHLLSGGLVALTAVFCQCVPAEAVERHDPAPATENQPKYGAIAYDKTNCAWGRSWNSPSQAGADDRAISECSSDGSKNCKVTMEVAPDQCGAVAATDKCDRYGWAARSDTRTAQQEALRQCQSYKPGQTCTIKVTVCSSQ
jgi:Domain of unknown function (DUF4189)